MFSAIKSKLSTKSPNHLNGQQNGSTSNNNLSMSAQLQKKFGRGVDYNMKVLIRGDTSTGKSTLFHRLQGNTFIEAYTPTEEIKVSSIQWNYKATDDVVKVDIWDVVDKGKKKIKLEGLKLDDETSSEGRPSSSGGGSPSPLPPNINGSSSPLPTSTSQRMAPAAIPVAEACLDAEFVDVYKGAHGVIFLFDVTKRWTFDYVLRQVPKVPKMIPVLILGNFLDQGHHRVISKEQATLTAVQLSQDHDMDVRYSESSMRNGFGLRFLHKYLSLPYLALQRQTLIGLLERNKRDAEALSMELELYSDTDESDYSKFSENLAKIRRNNAEKVAPKATADVVVGQLSNTIKQPENIPNRQKSPSPPKVETKAPTPTPQTSTSVLSARNENGFSPPQDINGFKPDSHDLDGFLDDDEPPAQTRINPAATLEESSDDDDDAISNNPMVAKIKEDLTDNDIKDLNISNLNSSIAAQNTCDERKVVKSPETKIGNEINIEEEDDSEDELGGNSLVKKPMDDYEDL